MPSESNSSTELLKYSSWIESHTFENCKLNRKSYGEFLFNYLIGEKDGFVLNIDSNWGSGKTEFLKRLYTISHIANHPVIYIDSWESDFSKDPLSVIAFELLAQIEKYMEPESDSSLADRVAELKGKLSQFKQKIALFAGIGTAAAGLGDSVGTGITNVVLDEPATKNEQLVENLSKNYQSQISAIKDIKYQLSLITELLEVIYGMKSPLIILVDELDRCRPTYAIEMLEVVKHFFNTEKVVFVIATDTKQLCHSIKAVYGNTFESETYLRRFFDRTAQLPPPEFEAYLSYQDLDFSKYSDIYLHPTGSHDLSLKSMIAILFKSYELEVRDLDQLLAQLHACLRAINNIHQGSIINLIVLFTAIIENNKNLPVFYSREDIDCSHRANPPKIFNIEDGFSSSDMINQSFDSIKHITDLRDDYGSQRRIITIQRPYFLNQYLGGNAGSKQLNFIEKISTMLRNAEGHRDSLWKWSQYKQCVELAGYIN
ncbi:KAP family P-loop NTPase fold protein [Shewanella sp. 0m-11]